MAEARAALVVNAQAREGEEAFERARVALSEAGLHVGAAHALHEPDEILPVLREALARGATQVIVGGGDGTISSAAGLLAGSPATLSVLPLGTANDFARSLRIPSELEDACRVAAGGAVREVDVARVSVGGASSAREGRPFLNAASFGVSSGLTRRLHEGDLKRRAGALAYPAAAAVEAAGHQPFRLRLDVDGQVAELNALQVVIGNGRYHGGGRLVAPGARPDDRRLEVYAVTAEAAPEGSEGVDRLRDLVSLARYALLLMRGRHLEHEGVVHRHARRVAVETEPKVEIDADGEVAGETPAVFELMPERLRVTVPW